MGAPIGTLICYLVMSIFNMIFVYRKLPEKPKLGRVFLKPFIASVVMGIGTYASYSLIYKVLTSSSLMLSSGRRDWLLMAAAMVVAVVIAVIIYAVLIIATKALTVDDIKLLPKGEKIAKLLKLK